MLQILKRKNADGYEEVLSHLGLNVDDVDISESFENDTVNGYAVYKITPDDLYIYCVDTRDDMVLYDGVIRSVLFLAALRGVERAHFMLEDKSSAVALGFLTVDSDVLEPISSVLGNCSGCNR